MLALEDMSGMSELEVKKHLSEEYAGKADSYPSDEEKAELLKKLGDYEILIAYESVGSWGCDSSSWFLLKHNEAGSLHIIEGSHCSCYGFEGQGDIDDTDIAYLASDKFYFPTGGYDENHEKNKMAVKEYIAALATAS